MTNFKLAEDQAQALADVAAALATGQKTVVFVGPAGSGKTTIMKLAIEAQKGREVVLCAPTGKAASVLAEKTGMEVSTIHSAIYGKVEEVENKDENKKQEKTKLVFGKPRPPVGPGGLVVVDEASMVGSKLAADLENWTFSVPNTQILYVGDKEQLPPVKDKWGADFGQPDAALTKVHRQAEDSAILMLSQGIRERTGFTGWNDDCKVVNDDPVNWLLGEMGKGTATLLCYTNKTRKALNNQVRAKLGFMARFEVGDRIVCLLNNKNIGIMNGETFGITAVKVRANYTKLTLDNGQEVYVNPEMTGKNDDMRAFRRWVRDLGGRRARKALLVDYGFCLTVHKSQGSQWDSVGFVTDGGFRWLKRDKPAMARRLSYTAVTRAAQTLRIFK